jgi:hypothetical protein
MITGKLLSGLIGGPCMRSQWIDLDPDLESNAGPNTSLGLNLTKKFYRGSIYISGKPLNVHLLGSTEYSDPLDMFCNMDMVIVS